ncbi:putative ribonuclease H-like domain-containing protein [Tanacetum coccineum]
MTDTKKTQKALLKQQYENFNATSSESLDSIFNRLQKLVSRLAILGVDTPTEDLNVKFLRSLPSEWDTHVVVWMNKPDFETMGLDDLYNNFKIVEQKVKRTIAVNNDDKNLAFLTTSSPSSTNTINTANTGISTGNTKVNTASTETSTASFSDATVYAFLSTQPQGMRARKFYLRTGRKIFMMDSSTTGMINPTVECFTVTIWGQLPSEARAPRNGADLIGVIWQRMKFKQTWLFMAFKISEGINDNLKVRVMPRAKRGFGYTAVPSPHPLILNRPTPLDLSYSGLEEFKHPEVNKYGPRDSSLKSTTVCDKESNNSRENTDDSVTQQPKIVIETSSVVSSLKVDKDWKEKFFHPANNVRPMFKLSGQGDDLMLLSPQHIDLKDFRLVDVMLFWWRSKWQEESLGEIGLLGVISFKGRHTSAEDKALIWGRHFPPSYVVSSTPHTRNSIRIIQLICDWFIGLLVQSGSTEIRNHKMERGEESVVRNKAKDCCPWTYTRRSAFLYGQIEEEVYVCQPPGFEDPGRPDKVYKVVKALYGLHQAPRAWYDTLATYLLSNGFQRGQIDQTLFIKSQKGPILLVQIYVDDIIFGSTKKEFCDEFEKLMKDKFQMSSMGELTFFLRLQFNYSDVKSASTPIDLEKPLVKDADADDVDEHLYRSMIGSLMYLTASRPDIMFAVCACARFQVSPKTSHLLAVKRIFRYLKGKPSLGLWYSKDSPLELIAYTDSDYAGATLDRKSTTGGCQFLGNRLISWQCKKQTVVATSTLFSQLEAEYVADASCRGQISVLGLKYSNAQSLRPKSRVCFVKFVQFHQIIDFITRSHICYALTKKPEVCVSFIKQFWRSAEAFTDGSLRRHLKLDDQDGITSLPTTEIFEQLVLMGYTTDSDKLTFQKGAFSPKWRFLSYLFIHCLSPKKTAWEKFSSNIAAAVICLATNRKFIQLCLDMQRHKLSQHTRFYSVPSLTMKVFSNMKRSTKGFSGQDVALFPTMLDDTEPSPSPSIITSSPSPTPSTSPEPSPNSTIPYSHPLLKPLTFHRHFYQTTWIGVLETNLLKTKKTYSSAYTKLILRVKKLESQIKIRKARKQTRVVISDDEINEGCGNTASEEVRTAGLKGKDPVSEEVPKLVLLRLLSLWMQEKEVKSQTYPVKERLLKRLWKRRGCSQEEREKKLLIGMEQEAEVSFPRKSTRKRQKMEEDSEKDELNGFLDIVPREEAPIEVESISTKFPIVDWKTCVLTETFILDVEELYMLVKNRYSASSLEGFDLMLWGDLHTLFEPDKDDEIWRDQHEYNILSWRLCDFCGIYILLMDNGLAIHMLTEKKYPLSQEMLTKMLSRKLEVDHESSSKLNSS